MLMYMFIIFEKERRGEASEIMKGESFFIYRTKLKKIC